MERGRPVGGAGVGRSLRLRGTRIDVAALRSGQGPAFTLTSGYHVGILTSRQDLGEGMAPSFPQYLGTYQPYAVWVPEHYDPRRPVPFYLSMHSLSSFHNQYRGGDAPDASYATYYEQLGDALGAVVATPLSRGPDGWYEAEALIDTLEVWSDVLHRFRIDPDRVYAGGYSMGGYGTYKLTTMMPDAFASAAVVVGPPTNGIWAYPLPPETDGRQDRPDNTYWQLESVRHVPTSIKHGTNDELVPVAGVVHQAQRYDELGYEYQFNLFPGHDHLSFAFADGWQEEADWLAGHAVRVRSPRRVTLDIRPSTWIEGASGREETIRAQLVSLTREVGTRLRGGYWISGVHLEDGSNDGTAEVDLVSHGIGTKFELAVAHHGDARRLEHRTVRAQRHGPPPGSGADGGRTERHAAQRAPPGRRRRTRRAERPSRRPRHRERHADDDHLRPRRTNGGCRHARLSGRPLPHHVRPRQRPASAILAGTDS